MIYLLIKDTGKNIFKNLILKNKRYENLKELFKEQKIITEQIKKYRNKIFNNIFKRKMSCLKI